MDQAIRAALAGGNLVEIFRSFEPDESYHLAYDVPCPVHGFDEDHGINVSADAFRWGVGVWLLTGDGTVMYGEAPDVMDATAKLAGFAEHFKLTCELTSLTKGMGRDAGVFTCDRKVNDDMSLVDTPFADTVIPDGI